MDINALLAQLPNFAGLVFCVFVLQNQNKVLQAQVSRLVEVIIAKENCEEPPTKQGG